MDKTKTCMILSAMACAASFCAARGEILVRDSFDAAAYSVGTGLKNLKPGASAGFAAGSTWGDTSSSGVFYVNGGLELPSDFIAVSSGAGIGVGQFTGTATGNREISRQIEEDKIKTSGTYYMRFACAISDSAEKYLSFKGFEMLGLLPDAHKGSAAISYPAQYGLQFGFYKFSNDDGTTALVVLKEGGQNANVTALKLVDPVVPGKTYIVVAKIVLDGAGNADVYAMAGAADDAAFREAALPETPFTVPVESSRQLRHLVLSGTFMTGYGEGRWATFDELAIGESLEDVFGFNNLSVPVLAYAESSGIGENGFTASARLTQVGSGAAEVFFEIMAEGEETSVKTSLGTFAETGDIEHAATGLEAGAEYRWRFSATGPGGEGATEWQKVVLAGAPVLGEPSHVLDGTAAT